jgi:hypothetical protein
MQEIPHGSFQLATFHASDPPTLFDTQTTLDSQGICEKKALPGILGGAHGTFPRADRQ